MRKLLCWRSSCETLLFESSASPKCNASAMQELTQAGVARGSLPGIKAFSMPKAMRSEQNVHFCATPRRATPACVNSCIADALHFGDVEDPDSNVSKLLRAHKSFKMHAELGTEPGFHYLYDKAAATPALDAPPAFSDAQAGRIRTRGVEPWHQKHWDWKASGNFLCGGAGAAAALS